MGKHDDKMWMWNGERRRHIQFNRVGKVLFAALQVNGRKCPNFPISYTFNFRSCRRHPEKKNNDDDDVKAFYMPAEKKKMNMKGDKARESLFTKKSNLMIVTY